MLPTFEFPLLFLNNLRDNLISLPSAWQALDSTDLRGSYFAL